VILAIVHYVGNINTRITRQTLDDNYFLFPRHPIHIHIHIISWHIKVKGLRLKTSVMLKSNRFVVRTTLS
jgi:hypothetical protein